MCWWVEVGSPWWHAIVVSPLPLSLRLPSRKTFKKYRETNQAAVRGEEELLLYTVFKMAKYVWEK